MNLNDNPRAIEFNYYASLGWAEDQQWDREAGKALSYYRTRGWGTVGAIAFGPEDGITTTGAGSLALGVGTAFYSHGAG